MLLTSGGQVQLIQNNMVHLQLVFFLITCVSYNQSPCRIQPSPSLCLVVEVQAAKYLDVYNQEVFKLVACGWTQLELFDQYNQVCRFNGM